MTGDPGLVVSGESVAFLDAAPDAVVIAEESGSIVFVNAHTEELFGFTRDELLGEAVEILLPERFREHHVEQRRGFFDGPSTRPLGEGLQLAGRHKSGSEFEVDIALSIVTLAERPLVIAFVRDVSERKLAQATSRDLRAQVRMVVELKRLLTEEKAAAETAQSEFVVRLGRMEEVDRMKDESVAVVTHELRTPLTAVLGYSQTLLEGEAGPLSEMQQHFLTVIERNSRRLVRIVDDLLFVARADSGVIDLNVELVDLPVLVEEAVDGARKVADANGVALKIHVEPMPRFNGDSARLSELIENLLANALKYTPSGGTVAVDLRRSDGHVVLEVADTGIGIPADEQPHLFDRFYRATSAIEHQIQGTGLGLTIVKMIVEAHAGDVLVESEVGVGTTVRIVLPVTVPTLREQEPQELEAAL